MKVLCENCMEATEQKEIKVSNQRIYRCGCGWCHDADLVDTLAGRPIPKGYVDQDR